MQRRFRFAFPLPTKKPPVCVNRANLKHNDNSQATTKENTQKSTHMWLIPKVEVVLCRDASGPEVVRRVRRWLHQVEASAGATAVEDDRCGCGGVASRRSSRSLGRRRNPKGGFPRSCGQDLLLYIPYRAENVTAWVWLALSALCRQVFRINGAHTYTLLHF